MCNVFVCACVQCVLIFFYKTEVSAVRVTTDAPWPGDDRFVAVKTELFAAASMAFGAALQ